MGPQGQKSQNEMCIRDRHEGVAGGDGGGVFADCRENAVGPRLIPSCARSILAPIVSGTPGAELAFSMRTFSGIGTSTSGHDPIEANPFLFLYISTVNFYFFY